MMLSVRTLAVNSTEDLATLVRRSD